MHARTSHRATPTSFLRAPSGVVRAASVVVAGALVAASAIVLTTFSAPANAAVTPTQPAQAPTAIACTSSQGILVSTGTNSSGATVSDISTADVSNGVFSKTKVSSLKELVNAIGYNPNDGLIYGMTSADSDAQNDNQFVKFDLSGSQSETYMGIPTLSNGTAVGVQYDAGVIASNNTWIGFARGTSNAATSGKLVMEKIAIPSTPAATVPVTQTTLTFANGTPAFTAQPRDVSFNPYDGLMYALMPDGFIYSITTGGLVTKVTTTATPNATWAGGSWTDSFGNMFFYQNGSGTTGQVYQFNPTTKAITAVGSATAYTDFDATSCLPVGLQKSVSPATIGPGTTATFTFALANPYGISVSVKNFVDTLPASSGMTWVANSVDTSDPAFSGATTTANGGTLTISPITLQAGSKVTFSAQAKVTGATASGSYVNQASAQPVVRSNTVTIVSDDPSLPGATDATPYTINVPTPTANPDTLTTGENTPKSIDPTTNDTNASTGGGTIVPSATRLIDADGNAQTSVATANGTYAVDTTTGLVTFTPATNFTGQAAPVTYRVQDSNGGTATSTITPTVTPAVPTATNDTRSTTQGAAVTIPASSNDVAGNANTPLDPSSIQFAAGSGTLSNGNRTLTIPNEGTYVANTDGTVTFTPVSTFTGTSTAQYTIAGTDGTRSNTATISVPVSPVAPRPQPDAGSTQQNTPITLNLTGNDLPGVTNGTPIDPSTVKLLATGLPSNAALSSDGKTLTIPAVGTWAVANDGTMTFTPVEGYTGSPSVVRYQVSDTKGQTGTSSITLTVTPVKPVATADTPSTTQGTAVTFDPLANDSAGNANTPLDPKSVVLDPLNSGGALSTDKKTLTVPGEGVYSVDPTTGKVTFTPDPSFSGTASQIGYTVADKDGTPASSTITPTVGHVPPRTTPDAGSGAQGDTIPVDVLANDRPGVDGGSALDPTSVVLQARQSGGTVSDGGKTLTIPNTGTFTVDPTTGKVTFTPMIDGDTGVGFVGTVPTIGYTVADHSGETSASTIDVVVDPSQPVANPDTATTPQGTPVAVHPLANDVPENAGSPIAANTLELTAPDGATTNPDGSITVPNEGTYVLTAGSDPVVTFTPVAGFAGTATPIGYTVQDSNGNPASSTITITVTATAPAVSPDSGRTQQNTPVTVDPLANDGDRALLDAGSVTLGYPSGYDSTSATLSGDAKQLTVPGVGTYRVQGDGTVVFTPADGYTTKSTAPVAVPYSVTGTTGKTASSTIAITVDPVVPLAVNDRGVTPQGTPVTLDTLGNDQPGNAATAIDPTTVHLTAGAGGTLSNGGRTLTIDQVGVFTVNTSTGAVTFTPVPAFSGQTPAVPYTVQDVDGGTATANVRVRVTPVPPVASDDAGTTQQNESVPVTVLGNDTPGIANGSPIDPTKVVLTTDGLPSGATLSSDAKTLTVPGEGTYVVDPTSGVVTFTATDTTGPMTPVTYRITDSAGQTATAVIRITVTATTPTEADVVRSTPQNTPVTVSPVWTSGNGATPIDPTTVRLLPVGSVQPTADGKSLTIAGQGTYTVDPTTGAVRFVPVDGFSGTATAVPYSVADTAGNVASRADASGPATITVTVTPVVPTAADDAKSTVQDTPTTVQPLTNDHAGRDDIALDPTSVTLLAVGTAAPSADGKSLTVPGQGTYVVDPTSGLVTFTPVRGYTGTATPVPYTVADVDGTTAQATITITVTPVAPTATNDIASTKPATAVRIDPLTNDTAGGVQTPLDPTSVRLTTTGLTGATLSTDGRTLSVPGQGTYVVDPTTGVVTFTPLGSFVGTATPVTYTVADVDGTGTSATITVSVAPPTLVARPDSGTTPAGKPITIDPLHNDSSPSGAPLDATTVVLLQPSIAGAVLSADGRTLTIPGEGVYRVDPATGLITFTPADGFTGTASPIQYSVADVDGIRVISTVTITVTPAAVVTPPTTGGGNGSTGAGTAPTATDPAGTALAFTGSSPGAAVGIALVVLLAGIGVTVVGALRPRRRRTYRRARG